MRKARAKHDLKDNEGALVDFSKYGELGFVGAYGAIKAIQNSM